MPLYSGMLHVLMRMWDRRTLTVGVMLFSCYSGLKIAYSYAEIVQLKVINVQSKSEMDKMCSAVTYIHLHENSTSECTKTHHFEIKISQKIVGGVYTRRSLCPLSRFLLQWRGDTLPHTAPSAPQPSIFVQLKISYFKACCYYVNLWWDIEAETYWMCVI